MVDESLLVFKTIYTIAVCMLFLVGVCIYIVILHYNFACEFNYNCSL